MSFAGDELAKGEVYYNSRMTKASLEELSGISVFHKDERGTSSIPIVAMGEETKRLSAPTRLEVRLA